MNSTKRLVLVCIGMIVVGCLLMTPKGEVRLVLDTAQATRLSAHLYTIMTKEAGSKDLDLLFSNNTVRHALTTYLTDAAQDSPLTIILQPDDRLISWEYRTKHGETHAAAEYASAAQVQAMRNVIEVWQQQSQAHE